MYIIVSFRLTVNEFIGKVFGVFFLLLIRVPFNFPFLFFVFSYLSFVYMLFFIYFGLKPKNFSDSFKYFEIDLTSPFILFLFIGYSLYFFLISVVWDIYNVSVILLQYLLKLIF